MSKTLTIPKRYDYKDGLYDLDSLFRYALDEPPFGTPDEITLHAVVMGENDEAEWYWIFEHDGQVYYASGGCDYTGWDCRSWGEVKKVDSIEAALAEAPEKENSWSNNRPIRKYLKKQIDGEWQLGVIEL